MVSRSSWNTLQEKKKKSLVPTAVIQHESLEFCPNFSVKVEIKFCIAVTNLDIKFSPYLTKSGNFYCLWKQKGTIFSAIIKCALWCNELQVQHEHNTFCVVLVKIFYFVTLEWKMTLSYLSSRCSGSRMCSANKHPIKFKHQHSKHCTTATPGTIKFFKQWPTNCHPNNFWICLLELYVLTALGDHILQFTVAKPIMLYT